MVNDLYNHSDVPGIGSRLEENNCSTNVNDSSKKIKIKREETDLVQPRQNV